MLHVFSFFFVFLILYVKMYSTDAKMQKIEPDLNIFMMDENFGGSV